MKRIFIFLGLIGLLSTNVFGMEQTIEKDLLKAVEEGNLEKAKNLIEQEADVNCLEKDRNASFVTPLYVAVEKENEDMVRFLLDNGANPLADCRLCICMYAEFNLSGLLLKNQAVKIFDLKSSSMIKCCCEWCRWARHFKQINKKENLGFKLNDDEIELINLERYVDSKCCCLICEKLKKYFDINVIKRAEKLYEGYCFNGSIGEWALSKFSEEEKNTNKKFKKIPEIIYNLVVDAVVAEILVVIQNEEEVLNKLVLLSADFSLKAVKSKLRRFVEDVRPEIKCVYKKLLKKDIPYNKKASTIEMKKELIKTIRNILEEALPVTMNVKFNCSIM